MIIVNIDTVPQIPPNIAKSLQSKRIRFKCTQNTANCIIYICTYKATHTRSDPYKDDLTLMINDWATKETSLKMQLDSEYKETDRMNSYSRL